MTDAERFAKDGYVVLPRVFDPVFIDELKAEYFRQFPDVANSSSRYKVGHLRLQVPIRMTGPYLSPLFYANPALLGLASAALGDNYLIDSVAIVTALPGAKTQHRHMDHDDLFPGKPFTRAVINAYAINVAIPLVDLTPDTGTTKLYRASHVKPRDDAEFELPYIQRGDCFAMDYRLTHQGTDNHASGERPMTYLVYARAWFTDLVNYGAGDRIMIAADDLAAVAAEHQVLFRRLAPERSGSGARSAPRPDGQ